MVAFTVDTKLFRELGELLVGRESTALVELIKNAYDADATKVTILGEKLKSTSQARIVVKDNGIGMSEDEFKSGFLRIAGRTKGGARPRSAWFKRRYTGEKGIGRLAAHKLARILKVESYRWDGSPPDKGGFWANQFTAGTINWDKIEALKTLDEVGSSDAVSVRNRHLPQPLRAGTLLELAPLRKIWTDKDIRQFTNEVATLVPPEPLAHPLPKSVVNELIFREPKIRDSTSNTGNFEIEFEGDLFSNSDEAASQASAASWVIEVDCDAKKRRLIISIEPTKRAREQYGRLNGFRIERALDKEKYPAVVSFQARILQREFESWASQYRGVRVYYEGFRVLPYGDVRDDWLELERDYRSRANAPLARLKRYTSWELPQGEHKEGISIQGNNAFMGGVFLTKEGSHGLEMLVNREGFLPGPEFEFIVEIVRLAIDLQVRVRYAETSGIKKAREVDAGRQKKAAARASAGELPTAYLMSEGVQAATQSLIAAKAAVSSGNSATAKIELDHAAAQVRQLSEVAGDAVTELSMLRVLSSLGVEHAAFIHEIRSLGIISQSVERALEKILPTISDPKLRRKLQAIRRECQDLVERLRRNAAYLTDMTGIEGRRRRSRQVLRERFAKVIDFYLSAAANSGISIINEMDPEARTPPMFPAEVSALATNLLSNAVKFAGEDGKVLVTSRDTEEEIAIRIENTGERVELRDAEKWFQPFRSTTAVVDERLGQGMGLGLTIVRSLVNEYGGAINFVRPSKGFATAIEIAFSKE